MIYYKFEKNQDGEILLCEPKRDRRFLRKTETVFSQCNGHMGIRAAYELKQLEESRGTFLGGFYHKAGEDEVTELVNCPDVTEFKICIEGNYFYPDEADVLEFKRRLNLMTGQLETDILYQLPQRGTMRVETRRFASHHEKFLFCHEIKLTFDRRLEVVIETGINGQAVNSGVSHFKQATALVFDKELMYSEFSCDDGQSLQMITQCQVNGICPKQRGFYLERRSVYETITENVQPGQSLTIQKYTIYHHSRTLEERLPEETMQSFIRERADKGYGQLYENHSRIMKGFWKYARIEIEGASREEEGVIAFAQYHLLGMVPGDTAGYSVGAKGLTGEGYKGHVFWDTEMFVMPFFTSLFPEVSKNLLQYRYDRLDGARKKAGECGYEGALYPWESAATGKEETPLYAALNIHTGKANKVWSGVKEHHVTADIILALKDYCRITGDQEFLTECGWEMILETACFWYSRAVYHEEHKRYEILDVIGPDEYTEHIDNNAYTNYLAYENVAMALDILEHTGSTLKAKYLAAGWKEKWKDFLERLYLPVPGSDGLIPQDDTFLKKKELPNIEEYRKSKLKQKILKDFSRDEVVEMQVLKQADLVMLLNLMPEKFTEEVIKKNVRYYEARSVHDSSLSYCAHALASARIGDTQKAYEFFQKALLVDLDTNETDSKDGIHSAALGGIVNCLIEGFAGVSFTEEGMEVSPHLPQNWRKMNFYRRYRGHYYKIQICGSQVFIEKEESR